jgi:type I restriction enzyme S subunit
MVGWEVKPLSEVAQFINGLWKGEEPPFVHVGVIRNTNFTKDGVLDDTDIAYLDVEIKKLQTRRLQFGDLILEKSGGGPKQPVGRVVLFDKREGNFSFSNFTAAIRVVDPTALDARFLHKYLHWVYLSGRTEAMQSHSTGIRNLNGDAYKAIKVAYPSLPEQRRIVAILDEALDGIATAKANAEENLRNARELFESRRGQVFSAAGDDWRQVLLGDACSIARGGSPRPIREFLTSEPEGVNWVKISDATASAKYIFATAEKIKPTGVSRSRLVHDGDFLLSNSMSFGRPYIMRTTGCIHDGWLVLSKYQDTFCQDFLYLLLGSKFVYQQFDRLASGSTVRNLNIDLASSVRVPAPPLDAQLAMAAELDELSEAVDQQCNLCQQKIAALDELKKSLLQQAFSGSLPGKAADKQIAEVA